ncbi:MAG: hypothetical protein C0592_09740 [Marinilabiliales bacterium]|nr:MAG: hypothetical protein C0592_09740 [Marinilabiliales bacterium]
MRAFLILIVSVISIGVFAQNNALILNDAVVVNITNGAVLSVDQTNQAGIITSGTGTGIINSEGEYNRVAWHIDNGTGSYVIPFGVAIGSQIPFTYNITAAGSALGTLVASTYATPDDNTTYPTVPPAVTNMDACYLPGCVDRSYYANDRFWVLRKVNWATDPTSNLTVTYRDIEHTQGLNTITESNLLAQYWDAAQWNPGWNLAIPLLGVNNSPVNQVNSINAGSGNFFTWVLVDLTNPLPIELAELRASCTDDQFPLIEWVTASETNNDYFTLERSTDAINWVEVTTISGAGNSTTPLYYSYTDENAPDGINYYRLIQTDFDGTSVEAGMVDVRCDQSNISQAPFDMNIYSDYEHQIHVTFYTEYGEDLIMQLYDVRGRLIWNRTMTSSEGMNHIVLDIVPVMDATYLFNLVGKEKHETKRFFLQ